MAPKKRSFKVTLEVPKGATLADCTEYILDAVSTWRGQLRPPTSIDDNDPGDPMWPLDGDTVKVTRLTNRRSKRDGGSDGNN